MYTNAAQNSHHVGVTNLAMLRLITPSCNKVINLICLERYKNLFINKNDAVVG